MQTERTKNMDQTVHSAIKKNLLLLRSQKVQRLQPLSAGFFVHLTLLAIYLFHRFDSVKLNHYYFREFHLKHYTNADAVLT